MNAIATLLIVLTVLMSVTLITFVVVLALFVRRIDMVSRDVVETLAVVKQEIGPLVSDVRQAVKSIDSLTHRTRDTVDRAGRLAEGLDRLLGGITVVEATTKALASSRLTVAAVLEGARQGLRVLKSVKGKSKEELGDE